MTGRLLDDMVGLLPQPENPAYRLCIIEYRVPNLPNGGPDKMKSGHRHDTVPLANSLILEGCYCQPIFYDRHLHEEVKAFLQHMDGIIVRINPGQLLQGGGLELQEMFEELLNEQEAPVWSSPRVQEGLGTKEALFKIRSLPFGIPDTLTYRTEAEFRKGFISALSNKPRVLKKNRGI